MLVMFSFLQHFVSKTKHDKLLLKPPSNGILFSVFIDSVNKEKGIL